MCGIAAWIKGPAKDAEKVKRILHGCAIRGLHSFGVAKPDGVEKFHALSDALEVADKAPFVFHNRYSTSGDWRDHTNNQPLERGGVSLAFNGTLDMGTKEEMEATHNVSLETTNDGELALIAFLEGGEAGLREFVQTTTGSFAGILLTGSTILAIRNERRPLWIHRGSSTILASTEDVLKRAGFEDGNTSLQPGKIYKWKI